MGCALSIIPVSKRNLLSERQDCKAGTGKIVFENKDKKVMAAPCLQLLVTLSLFTLTIGWEMGLIDKRL